MIDHQLALVRARRSNIQRYRSLLQTSLTELERRFIERRLTEEQCSLENMTKSTPNSVREWPKSPGGQPDCAETAACP
jgi:hypothetical protein